MKKTIWFKAKKYGYGWTPVTWQGWLILLIFVAALTANVIRLNAQHSVSDFLINLVPETIVMVLLLIYICYLTGEKPGWRWGNEEPKDKDKHKK